ncbi:hypothetical protein NC653_032061 [Populus alba x Populus x berolinensis]|uniref:Uncharacterized protein n=1 Tax=Populus alba x Populus x berolinensis TaxID=444605 RepID=A0AAD6LQG3_9ROSI|nr:hypothetical protein NC653_032061 [Populus alba x Populus x berolinensis]
MEADDLCTSEMPSAQDIQDVWKEYKVSTEQLLWNPFQLEEGQPLSFAREIPSHINPPQLSNQFVAEPIQGEKP